MLCVCAVAQVSDLAFADTKITMKKVRSRAATEQSSVAVQQPAGEKQVIPHYSKLHLAGLAYKDFVMRYEKLVSKQFSARVSFRFLPNAGLPFATTNLKGLGGVPNTIDIIDNFRLSNLAFTPELRICLNSKGNGHGFYIAPFYRYASFREHSFLVDFVNDAGKTNSLKLHGNLTSSTLGMMLGAQWKLSKRLFFNWWLLGPHYNSANGLFNGTSSRKLSHQEQNNLRDELRCIDSPLERYRVSVTAQGTCLQMGGAWSGLKGGLSVGIKL